MDLIAEIERLRPWYQTIDLGDGVETPGRSRPEAKFELIAGQLPGSLYQNMSIYDLGRLDGGFDVVLLLGLLYHLRHPQLSLDLLAQHCVEFAKNESSFVSSNEDADSTSAFPTGAVHFRATGDGSGSLPAMMSSC